MTLSEVAHQLITQTHHSILMTVQEMYQEMQQQLLEDVLAGYNENDLYDDSFAIVEIDYTTQE